MRAGQQADEGDAVIVYAVRPKPFSDAEVRPAATASMTLPAADLPRSAPFASTSGACATD